MISGWWFQWSFTVSFIWHDDPQWLTFNSGQVEITNHWSEWFCLMVLISPFLWLTTIPIIPKSSQNHPNFTISPVYTIYDVCGLQWLTTIPITPKWSQFYNITSLYYIQCVACSGLQLSQSPQNDPNFTISPVYTILGSLNNIHIYFFFLDLPRNMGISYWFIWISNQLMIEW
jgi:hypothetical protein